MISKQLGVASTQPLVLALVLSGFLAGGCNRNASGPSGSEQSANSAPAVAAQPTAFEKCLSAWATGDQNTAVQDFLEMDLREAKLFSPGSALSLSEPQFAALPQAGREKLSAPMLADLASLKALCTRVKEAGLQARAGGDSAKATKCFDQIMKLGERLDQPSLVVVAQKTGQGLKRLASP